MMHLIKGRMNACCSRELEIDVNYVQVYVAEYILFFVNIFIEICNNVTEDNYFLFQIACISTFKAPLNYLYKTIKYYLPTLSLFRE